MSCMCDFCMHEVHVLKRSKEKCRSFALTIQREYGLSDYELNKALEVLRTNGLYYCLKRKLVIAHKWTLDCGYFVPKDDKAREVINKLKVKT